MTESTNRKTFLDNNQVKIINKLRDVDAMVNYMKEKNVYTPQLANTIIAKNTRENQVRTALECLNCSKHYDLMFKWLEENESGLMEDLDWTSYHEGPERKRPKIQEEAVTETDSCVSKTFDLKTTSTFAKLEEWVSNNENLIQNLESKLSTTEMKNLEKNLKNKRLKKSLCFNTEDVRKITSNRKLELFLACNTNATFPDLAIQLFFENDLRCVSPANDSLIEKDMEGCTDDYKKSVKHADSGYEYRCSSSDISNTSLHSKHLPQNVNLIRSEDTCMKNKEHFDKLPVSEPKFQGGESNIREQKQDLHGAYCQRELDTEQPAALEGTMDKDDAHLEKPVDIQNTVGEQNMQFDNNMVNIGPKGPNICTQGRRELQLTDTPELEMGLNASVESEQMMPHIEGKVRFCSTPLNSSKQIAQKIQTRQPQHQRRIDKAKNKKDLLHNWAKKKCSNEKLKNPLDCISIINKAEHSVYPIFVADTIMVYKNPQSDERQIIFVSDENKKVLPKAIKTFLNYQMWVCGIKKTILIKKVKDEEQEQEINYEQFDQIVDLCQRFILEAFLPAFAVFKKLQKKSKL
ncbi:uncharacterized protein LOC113572280 [Electrophorus electricus]|uniref:uncharacterized protein LOC113572280 n=1 Tax=Electrophorus electricus TaxID=8005 RepID=UPI0015D09F2D|nr:uncharacterized protein LOC113572280 [Electrophorus electricus]